MKIETLLGDLIAVERVGSLVFLNVGTVSLQLSVNEAREVAAMLEAVARSAESNLE